MQYSNNAMHSAGFINRREKYEDTEREKKGDGPRETEKDDEREVRREKIQGKKGNLFLIVFNVFIHC